MQHTTNTTNTGSGPVATRTLNIDSTDSGPILGLEGLRAAIPEQGIKPSDLYKQFRQYLSAREFVEVASEVSRYDSATRILYPTT